MRKIKMEKHQAEELAQVCAVIMNLVDELQATVPIADDVVEDMILNPFIQGGYQLRNRGESSHV